MNTFSELPINSKIFQAIDACGYETPTEIQAKTIPPILEGHDVIGATETGSGKTAAFVLPALHLLAETKKQNKARVLILTPTRELADQITAAIHKYGKFSKPSTASIIGGASYRNQERMLSRPLDIIVATPGRLLDHLRNNRIDLSAIEMFILDEADRMLDMGFIDDVKQIAKSMPPKKQTLLFTATLNKGLIKSVGYLLENPIVIDLSKPKMVPTQIKQQLFIADNQQQKITFLENLLDEASVFKGIIFSATKIGADRIAYHLRNQGHNALALHGDLKQRVRKQSLEKLNSGNVQYLVATDVASRGIDIPNVSHVINFDIPRCSDDYIHRVGRTGRAGKPGVAISLATKDERRLISSIERHVGTKLELIDEDRQPTVDTYVEEQNKTRKRRSGKSFQGQRRQNDRPNGERSFKSRSNQTDRRFQNNDGYQHADKRQRRNDASPQTDRNKRFDQRPSRTDDGYREANQRPRRFENKDGNNQTQRRPQRFDDRTGSNQTTQRRPQRFDERTGSNQTQRRPQRFDDKTGSNQTQRRSRSNEGYHQTTERRQSRFGDKPNQTNRKPRSSENRSSLDRKPRISDSGQSDRKLRLGKSSKPSRKKSFVDSEIAAE